MINEVYGQEAIDRYNVEAPIVQLSMLAGKDIYIECSLKEAEDALQAAKKFGKTDRVVMLTSWGHSKHEIITGIW